MKTKIILSLIIGLCYFQDVLADSPLTSTDFSLAYYENEKIVLQAKTTSGSLTPELMDYLYARKNPLELKLAVINTLSWDIDGKNNAELFKSYLLSKRKYKTENDILKKANGGILICLAYLKALDNYFDVSEAITIAKKAKEKNKKSYATFLISGIIEAQNAMNDDWCNVYHLTNNVRENHKLKKDRFNKEANTIIFEYMDLYEDYCQ